MVTKVPQDFIASASVNIEASPADVWHALTDPAMIRQYFFGTTVTSDWKVGSPITWQGEWQGKPYADKGVILQLRPRKLLQFTHFSPLAGLADVPENTHTVTIRLTNGGTCTHVFLSQDHNPTEEARDHAQQNWQTMLAALKELLEK